MFNRVTILSSFGKRSNIRGFKNVSPANSKVMKVAVLGAAGRTGRCLSLLLKRSSMIDELSVYDESSTESLALELNHVDTPCKVRGYTGLSNIEDALNKAKVVVITAGLPAKYQRSGGEMLKNNAQVLADLIPNVIQYSPGAMVALVTSPVNILIPLIAEMYKKAGHYDLKNIFGVTTLDCVRSNTFAAEILGLPPETVVVPVIGGNCAKTTIPLFSHMRPCCKLTNEEISGLTLSVKQANDDLLRKYNGNGSPCLSMAFAAARFCISLCKGLRGLPNVVECAYVRSCVVPDVTYFSSPMELGPNGIQRNLGVPALTDYECKMLDLAIPLIQSGIKIGERGYHRLVYRDPILTAMMEILSDRDSLCLEKFQREALICLNTFPDKVSELNNLIDEYTPEAVKKTRGNLNRRKGPSCPSINSTTPDHHFHDAGSCYSATTYRDRCRSRNGICKRKYRPYLRRQSRPLAHILAILVNRLAVCAHAIFIKPSKFLMDGVTGIFLQRKEPKRVKCGDSTTWNTLNSKDNRSLVNGLICTMRPAAVRLIADTTILKRWLQARALASTTSNSSLSQAIRTTETIDGWAYELFFHLKYLQVINFPCEGTRDTAMASKSIEKYQLHGRIETARNAVTYPQSDIGVADDVMHTNLWHRIVQLRDHYVILFETLRNDDQFLVCEEPKVNPSDS